MLIFRFVPLGLPSITGSHVVFCLVKLPSGFLRIGIIFTALNRHNTAVSKIVNPSNVLATIAVAFSVPSRRSTRPHTPVATAPNTNFKLCVIAKPALTRG
jgi:hypothetical protein